MVAHKRLDSELKKAFVNQSSLVHYFVVLACPVLYFYSLWSLVVKSTIWSDFGSVVGITYSIIISGLLSHEAIHNSIFRSREANYYYGELMSLINGAFFVSFKHLSQQHIQHHVNNVGYDGFSLVKWTKGISKSMCEFVILLESYYIPVLSYIAAWRAVLLPLTMDKYRYLRPRIYLSLLFRVAFFGIMGYQRPASVLLYLTSHILVINIFRVFDCFHHTFDVVPLGTKLKHPGEDYEQENTYSSLFSRVGFGTILNFLFLNYGFHNAHHYLPVAPWYELPAIDAAMFPNSEAHVIQGSDLFYYYHANRINRIKYGLGHPTVGANGKLDISKYWGIIMNISFIVYDIN